MLDVLRRWYAEHWSRYVDSDEWWGHERHRIIGETPRSTRSGATAWPSSSACMPRPSRASSASSRATCGRACSRRPSVAATMSINEYWYEKGVEAGVASPAKVVEYASP